MITIFNFVIATVLVISINEMFRTNSSKKFFRVFLFDIIFLASFFVSIALFGMLETSIFEILDPFVLYSVIISFTTSYMSSVLLSHMLVHNMEYGEFHKFNPLTPEEKLELEVKKYKEIYNEVVLEDKEIFYILPLEDGDEEKEITRREFIDLSYFAFIEDPLKLDRTCIRCKDRIKFQFEHLYIEKEEEEEDREKFKEIWLDYRERILCSICHDKIKSHSLFFWEKRLNDLRFKEDVKEYV